MPDFFIRAFEMIIGVIIFLMLAGVVLLSISAAMGNVPGNQGDVPGGPITGLIIFVLGMLYVLFLGGAMYLGVGIYHNTKRTADQLEQMGYR